MYGKGLWGVRNSGGSIFLHELPFGGWEDLDIDASEDLSSATDSGYYEEGEEDQALWDDSDSTVYLDDLADEPLDEPETEYVRYKGYLITGTPSSKYVCISPYGAFSPKSYATVEEAKQAIDADDKIRWQDHYMPRE